MRLKLRNRSNVKINTVNYLDSPRSTSLYLCIFFIYTYSTRSLSHPVPLSSGRIVWRVILGRLKAATPANYRSPENSSHFAMQIDLYSLLQLTIIPRPTANKAKKAIHRRDIDSFPATWTAFTLVYNSTAVHFAKSQSRSVKSKTCMHGTYVDRVAWNSERSRNVSVPRR